MQILAALRAETTADQLYALIPVAVRAAVDAAREYRSNLAGVRALTGMASSLTSAEAAALGINVLHEAADGKMSTGIFDLPSLNNMHNMVPRSELRDGRGAVILGIQRGEQWLWSAVGSPPGVRPGLAALWRVGVFPLSPTLPPPPPRRTSPR